MKPAPFRQSCLVPTSDDWHPSIFTNDAKGTQGPFVSVSLIEFLGAGGWRVNARGNDDTGMEKDFPRTEKQAAFELYALITGGGTINMKDLLDLGFVWA